MLLPFVFREWPIPTILTEAGRRQTNTATPHVPNARIEHLLLPWGMGKVRLISASVLLSCLAGVAWGAPSKKANKDARDGQSQTEAKARKASQKKPTVPSNKKHLKTNKSSLANRISKALRLDEGLIEINTGAGTGVPGIVSVGAYPTLAIAGKKMSKKAVRLTISPDASAQAYVATLGLSYYPESPGPSPLARGQSCTPIIHRSTKRPSQVSLCR